MESNLLPTDFNENSPAVVEKRIFSRGRGEIALRKDMLMGLERLTVDAVDRIELLCREARLRKKIDPIAVLQKIIATAVRNDGWACDDAIVHMAFYAHDSDFFTLFFHEAGHALLYEGGIFSSAAGETEAWEEEWCWAFSNLLCDVTNLPFSTDRQYVSQLQLLGRELLNIDANSTAFEDALFVEEKIFGFHFFDSQFLEWSDAGVPLILRPSNHRSH